MVTVTTLILQSYIKNNDQQHFFSFWVTNAPYRQGKTEPFFR